MGYPQKNLNPWGLTRREVDMMDAMCETGSLKGAARRLGLTEWGAGVHQKHAYAKMGVHEKVRACIIFDRWRQAEGKGVPA